MTWALIMRSCLTSPVLRLFLGLMLIWEELVWVDPGSYRWIRLGEMERTYWDSKYRSFGWPHQWKGWANNHFHLISVNSINTYVLIVSLLLFYRVLFVHQKLKSCQNWGYGSFEVSSVTPNWTWWVLLHILVSHVWSNSGNIKNVYIWHFIQPHHISKTHTNNIFWAFSWDFLMSHVINAIILTPTNVFVSKTIDVAKEGVSEEWMAVGSESCETDWSSSDINWGFSRRSVWAHCYRWFICH